MSAQSNRLTLLISLLETNLLHVLLNFVEPLNAFISDRQSILECIHALSLLSRVSLAIQLDGLANDDTLLVVYTHISTDSIGALVPKPLLLPHSDQT